MSAVPKAAPAPRINNKLSRAGGDCDDAELIECLVALGPAMQAKPRDASRGNDLRQAATPRPGENVIDVRARFDRRLALGIATDERDELLDGLELGDPGAADSSGAEDKPDSPSPNGHDNTSAAPLRTTRRL